MARRSIRHFGTALIMLVAFVCQETWALASTTGGLTGTVVDADTSAPIAGAEVTASSPSQNATTTTDAAGRFTFLTLGPDTYTVTASRSGYQSTSIPGQIVFADTVQNVSVRMPRALRTIAHVTSAAGGALVKSGTTADVYSINASTQAATAAMGGGGMINQAYSAISTVPGAYVIPNQTGYYATTKSATSLTAFPSIVRLITMPRARPRRSVTPKSRSIPAQTPRPLRAKASRDSSIRSSRPVRFPAPRSVRSGSAPQTSTTARQSRSAGRRPTGTSRTTSASPGRTKPSITSTRTAARSTITGLGPR